MKKHAANIVTSLRIPLSIAILFFTAFSAEFYVLYLLACITDMCDGYIARKTNSVSELGSKLDTVADLVLVAVCMVKILPVIELPIWLIVWVGVIAIIKIFNMTYGYLRNKEFVAVHSILNKITGGLLFLIPLAINLVDIKYIAIPICLVATIAAINEGMTVMGKK